MISKLFHSMDISYARNKKNLKHESDTFTCQRKCCLLHSMDMSKATNKKIWKHESDTFTSQRKWDLKLSCADMGANVIMGNHVQMEMLGESKDIGGLDI